MAESTDITGFAQSHRISLVIPCYNESHRIHLLVNGLTAWQQQWPGPWEAIIVDDGSRDNTARLLEADPALAELRKHMPIHIVSYQPNRGKGYALKTGIAHATGDYVLTLDADMSTPPVTLLEWIKLAGGSFSPETIYIGSREHPRSTVSDPGQRRLAGRVFNRIIRWLTPLKVRDTQCGFKLYPAAAARDLFSRLRTYGWAHDVEILYRARLDAIPIEPLPVTYLADPGTRIKLFRDSISMFWQVLRIRQMLKS